MELITLLLKSDNITVADTVNEDTENLTVCVSRLLYGPSNIDLTPV